MVLSLQIHLNELLDLRNLSVIVIFEVVDHVPLLVVVEPDAIVVSVNPVHSVLVVDERRRCEVLVLVLLLKVIAVDKASNIVVKDGERVHFISDVVFYEKCLGDREHAER